MHVDAFYFMHAVTIVNQLDVGADPAPVQPASLNGNPPGTNQPPMRPPPPSSMEPPGNGILIL